jgi:hypothetical protein
VRLSRFNVQLLAVVTALAGTSAACGDFIQQDRAPVTLVIDSLQAAPVLSTIFSGTLQSDVITNVNDIATIISDTGRVTMRLVMKDVGTAPSPVNGVTINRYRVMFRRSDGRNTPGVDVPFPFDSALTFTVPPTGTVTAGFELVRHVAKEEAPLLALRASAVVISTVADVTFFGRDQAGHDLSVTGSIGVQFGNFGDP